MDWNKFYTRNRLVSRIKGLEEQSRTLRVRIKKAEAKERASWPFRNLKRAIGKEARHHLLAYALIKGVPYKAIEPKCREKNEPNAEAIFKVIEQVYFYISDHWSTDYFKKEWNIDRVRKWLDETIEETKIEEIKEVKSKSNLFDKIKSIVGE